MVDNFGMYKIAAILQGMKQMIIDTGEQELLAMTDIVLDKINSLKQTEVDNEFNEEDIEEVYQLFDNLQNQINKRTEEVDEILNQQ